MTTWNDFKRYAKSSGSIAKIDTEEAEELANIVSVFIQRRNELNLSQRDLAALCGLPQSSITRFETMKSVSNINTMIRLYLCLLIFVFIPYYL